MSYDWDNEHKTFIDEHTWAVLATGRKDGSPQQSMVGYIVDDEGRIVISAKAFTAKWKNAVREPKVSLTVPDGRRNLIVYGAAEAVDTDPQLTELTGAVLARMFGNPVEPDALASMIEQQQRTILRITPVKALRHD